MNWLNNPVNSMLEKSLDALWLRNQAINENIANADTPNYKRKYVEFEDVLKEQVDNIQSEMKKGTSFTKGKINGMLSEVKPEMKVDETTMRVDGSGVDTDQEYTELAKTQLQYLYGTRLMTDAFTRIRSAIKG